MGCGKTVVAALAAARAVGSGQQVAIMAPTELLAEQHWRNLSTWFKALDLPVALLTGSQPARTRRSAELAIGSGEMQIVVGTHALFQKGINFAKLALIIVDEQHRFGVQQRMTLQEKGRAAGLMPHQLIMTATPIPRTLAMTAYADLDISVIDELPPGRTPVVTVVMADVRRHEVVQRILLACRAGRQAYWVCPLIDESEELRYQAAEETAIALREATARAERGAGAWTAAGRAEGSHDGRLQGQPHPLARGHDRDRSGRGCADATLMVIENAERMGLAQLHQLRRPGRTRRASLDVRAAVSRTAVPARAARGCIPFVRPTMVLRLPAAIWNCADRANCSVPARRAWRKLRVADLARDTDLLPVVQHSAELMLRDYPDNITPLTTRWIGDGERYGTVG